jgi:hypothetical protein
VELATFGQITGSFSPNKDLQRRCDVEPPGGGHTWGTYNKPAGCSTPAFGAPHNNNNNNNKDSVSPFINQHLYINFYNTDAKLRS